LSKTEASDLSIAARQSYDVEGITELFAEQLRVSDQMWKDINGSSLSDPLVPAVVDVTITGVTADEFRSSAGNVADMGRDFVRLNPEHYFFGTEGERARVPTRLRARG
jgi:hypothetical protein